MVSDSQLHVAEGELTAAAYVHWVAVAALGAEVIDDLEIGYDQGSGSFRDGGGVAHMIAVAVSHKDRIQVRELVSPDVSQGVAAQERVNEHSMALIIEFPAIVSMISQLQHSNLSLPNLMLR
jgi:hypothetical protein